MSSDITIFFVYEGETKNIQCNKSAKMSSIFSNFRGKIKIDKDKKLYYLYNGKKINEELKYEDIVNNIDREKNQMTILVIEENKIAKENIKEINEIICPKCGENALMEIQNYRINMNCKNNHNFSNLSINEIDNILKIDISKIECNS